MGLSAIAGLAGGVVMLVVWFLGNGPSATANAIASLYPPFRPPVAAYVPTALFAGVITHLVIAAIVGVVYGLIVGWLMPSTLDSYSGAAIMGLTYGLAIYFIGGLWLGPTLVPAFGHLFMPTNFLGHLIAYGAVTALTLALLARQRGVMAVTFAPEPARVPETTVQR